MRSAKSAKKAYLYYSKVLLEKGKDNALSVESGDEKNKGGRGEGRKRNCTFVIIYLPFQSFKLSKFRLTGKTKQNKTKATILILSSPAAKGKFKQNIGLTRLSLYEEK